MISLDTALAFFGLSVLLALAPGPDNIFVLLQSARWGPRAGLAAVSGLCSGLVVHTAAVALGVAAVIAASATAFTVLKVLGAMYLLYLAWQAWRASGNSTHQAAPAAAPLGALYRRGILMSVSNPKLSIFFLAFLPQFIHPEQGSVVMQTVELGLLFMLAAFMVFSVIAFCAGSLGRAMARSPRAERNLNRIASLVFLGLAIKLVTASR